MLYWGMWYSGKISVIGGRLDWMILEVFSNLDDSMILWLSDLKPTKKHEGKLTVMDEIETPKLCKPYC